MKICFLTETLFLYGGVARVVTTIANELSKIYDVDVVCTLDYVPINYEMYNLSKERVNVIYKSMNLNFLDKIKRKLIKKLNVQTDFLNKKKYIKYYSNIIYPNYIREEFIKFFNQKNYDVIIGCHTFLSMFLGLISNKLKANTIGWQHNSFDAYFVIKNDYIYNEKELFEYCLKNLDQNIVLTDDDKLRYDRYLNLEAERIYNPNSFQTNKLSKLSTKQFLAVGRLADQKGFDLLIKSFKLFHDKNKEWILTIVGEGKKHSQLKELIKIYNLEDFVFLKPFTNNIKKYYIESSVYLLSSRYEGWGLVWAEAMVCGLPIVSFDLPALVETTKDKNVGFLVESGNVEEFAKGMLQIVSDKNELNIKSKNAINLAKEFNVTYVGEQWCTIINKVKNNRGLYGKFD